jgi:hypothetical protein
METLKRSGGGSQNIFTEATHGEDEINSSDVAKLEKASVSRSV